MVPAIQLHLNKLRSPAQDGFRLFHIHGSPVDGPADGVSRLLIQSSNVICSAAVEVSGVEPSIDRRDFCTFVKIRLKRATSGDRSTGILATTIRTFNSTQVHVVVSKVLRVASVDLAPLASNVVR